MKKYSGFKWSISEIKEKASKCKTRSEFHKKYRGASFAAHKLGILEEVLSLIGPSLREPYSLKQLKTIALKYQSREEFKKKNSGAHSIASKRGILDQICSHMKAPKGSSEPEKQLLLIIKEKFNSARKIRHNGIKIEDKPYIHGFEIDIFVPELNKGIEFDGRRYHSKKWLIKKRGKWPLKDALNKHQIKDDYFLSKGIQLMHVKEQDWIDNKEECIKRCFEFLNDKN